ncbi:MAG TPA: site-2 protease family protein [Candidatus Thalassarchaeaceae archaeon]|nr:site-2 protease family protein [Candidatus Thalassarchaeaceae archaeon]
MVRDSGSGGLEDDPFDRLDRKTRASTDNSQRIRVVIQPGQNNPFEPFLRGFFQVPQPNVIKHEGSFFHFSQKELKDLAISLTAFSLGLSFVFNGGLLGGMLQLGPALLFTIPFYFILASIAFGPAFIIHELAHKFVARHYGCWAEFRADYNGLKNGVLIAFFIGFLFMAPGAVMVAGRVSRKENGIISIAGPISNIVLFFIGMIGGGLLLSVLFHSILAEIVELWMWGNAILGAFNMLPFGPLDGAKVKNWSEPIFWLFLVITLGLVFTLFNGLAIETMESIAGI